MTELIEKEGKEIGQIFNENWTNFSNFILPSNGVRQLNIVYHNLYEFYERYMPKSYPTDLLMEK